MNGAATAAFSPAAALAPSTGVLEPPQERETRLVGALQLAHTLLLVRPFERDRRVGSNMSMLKFVLHLPRAAVGVGHHFWSACTATAPAPRDYCRRKSGGGFRHQDERPTPACGWKASTARAAARPSARR